MGFEQRTLLWDGPVEGTKTSHEFTAETDGFLTLFFNGQDIEYSYAVAVLHSPGTPLNPHPIPWPILTWAYSFHQDFTKSVTTTIPLQRGGPYLVDWGSRRRKAGELGIQLTWMPVT